VCDRRPPASRAGSHSLSGGHIGRWTGGPPRQPPACDRRPARESRPLVLARLGHRPDPPGGARLVARHRLFQQHGCAMPRLSRRGRQDVPPLTHVGRSRRVPRCRRGGVRLCAALECDSSQNFRADERAPDSAAPGRAAGVRRGHVWGTALGQVPPSRAARAPGALERAPPKAATWLRPQPWATVEISAGNATPHGAEGDVWESHPAPAARTARRPAGADRPSQARPLPAGGSVSRRFDPPRCRTAAPRGVSSSGPLAIAGKAHSAGSSSRACTNGKRGTDYSALHPSKHPRKRASAMPARLDIGGGVLV
jgi:hypothetical protein